MEEFESVESIVRSFLANAAARLWAAQRAGPEDPSVDYRTGFAAGKEAGEVGALALVLAELTGESVTALIEVAQAQAAVESAMPFELRLEVIEGGGQPDPTVSVDAAAVDAAARSLDLVPCPTCWLPADVLAPLAHDTNHRSRCPRGHENTLIPAVLDHLRSLMGPDLGESTG